MAEADPQPRTPDAGAAVDEAPDQSCPNYPATCRGCVECRSGDGHDGPCFCDCPTAEPGSPHTLLFDVDETSGTCACGVRFGPLADSRAVLAAHYAHVQGAS